MIDGKRVLALIPARGGSKGLPGKNIMPLNGRPLLGWPVAAAKGSRYVDKTVVSTDDPRIAEVALAQGAEVPFLRPSECAADDSPTMAAVEHALSTLRQQGEIFDYLVLLEPTSPLTESLDVDLALERLTARRGIADSIVGVSEVVGAHPVFDVHVDENQLIRPYLGGDFSRPMRRQDISKLYFLEGSLYISAIDVLLNVKSFYHARTLAYEVPKWKSLELDDRVDFICIEAIMKNLASIKFI